ncbi:MAG: hypothetical protein HQL05_03785 [Nitrospirae bacterium]|uniref:hypothetical protein n=1 Tax=Candidatus Magnetobacterium casense TaxID=1455061 RepID=UPI00058B25E6|nr:hypothetical protein [Candidatus Magnetobacterium casensis]MBF0336930.1 hypothetical protein [Nitrospirota bacterium]
MTIDELIDLLIAKRTQVGGNAAAYVAFGNAPVTINAVQVEDSDHTGTFTDKWVQIRLDLGERMEHVFACLLKGEHKRAMLTAGKRIERKIKEDICLN